MYPEIVSAAMICDRLPAPKIYVPAPSGRVRGKWILPDSAQRGIKEPPTVSLTQEPIWRRG